MRLTLCEAPTRETRPKMDQKVCLNMVKKDQLCGTALKKRN